MGDAHRSNIVITCDTVEEAIKSDGFFEFAGLLLLHFCDGKEEYDGVVEIFKRVMKGGTIGFEAYERLSKVLFDTRFLDFSKMHFDERILGTKKKFETISLEALRQAFIKKAVASLVHGVLTGDERGTNRKVDGFGVLDVMKTGALYIIRDTQGNVYNVGYNMPSPHSIQRAFFEKDGTYMMFDTSLGKLVSTNLCFHSTFDFTGTEKTGLFINNSLSSNRILSTQGTTLYTSKQTLKFMKERDFFLEGNFGEKECFAIVFVGGEMKKYQVQRDPQRSDEEKEIYFYVVDEKREDIEILLPKKKKFG